MGTTKVGRAIKRFSIVTIFPAFTALSIYVDWNHTRLWKKRLAEEKKLQLSN